MGRSAAPLVAALAYLLAACSGPDAGKGPPSAADGDSGGATDATDAAMPDSGPGDGARAPADGGDVATDAGVPCSVSGAPGECVTLAACAALANHTSVAGYCSGPTDIECCIETPSTADNPPIPAGYKLMAQSQVTPDMTSWAVSILHDPITYPMFATATKTFGTLAVLARVEWHPPDFLNSAVHRGVTLYVPM